MSLQGCFNCSGWLDMSNFMRQRIPDRKSDMGKWVMSMQMFWSSWVECAEFLSQRRNRAFLMKSRHKEGQADKQGLYQRKRSDRVLTEGCSCQDLHIWTPCSELKRVFSKVFPKFSLHVLKKRIVVSTHKIHNFFFANPSNNEERERQTNLFNTN